MIQFTPLSAVSGPQCAALHESGFPQDQVWDAAFITKLLNLPTTHGTLATVDGMPAGFVLWQHGPDTAEIYTLVVVPHHRRQGLASSLLRDVERALCADGITRVLLDVATDNPAAQQLYNKNGYAEIARRKDYYTRTAGPHADAIVMEKILKA